ncbi:MAG: hypothetical protein CL610_27465 [Anaerolineaceae bacterium]|nr:hypothetical protein [Anaerolineaceae bacterium]
MRPGLSRAVPMGILGFLIGMVILVAIRGLQGLQPLMDPQLAIILGTILAAGFFVYGMGALDPRMNQHAHEPEEGEEAHAMVVAEESVEEPAPPGQILGGYLWQLSTIVVLLLIGILVFALLPEGPALRTVHQEGANVSAVGYVPITIGAETYYISQLTALLGFIIFMFVSLAVVAGGLGMVFFGLNQGVKVVKDTAHTPLEAEPLEAASTSEGGLIRWLGVAVAAVAGFAIIDFIIGAPITNEFATVSFFLAAGCVFAVAFVLVGAVIRFVAAQRWAWLVRALIILGVAGLILGPVTFAVVWFMLSGLSVVAAAIFSLIVLATLVFTGLIVGMVYAVVVGILIPLFYFLLIGLIVPFAPPLLFGISAGNALLIAAIILRPKFIVHWIAYGAAWTAKQLRRLPGALQ